MLRKIILMVVLVSCFAYAEYTLSWNTEEKLTAGDFSMSIQLNIDNQGACNAKRVAYFGYDYPGFDVDAPGECKRCGGTGTLGVGSISNVPDGSDTFNECDTTGCGTGTCSGGSCGYYTSGQHNCGTCYSCDGTGSCAAQTVDGASATALGCSAGDQGCRRCNSGSCTYYTSGQHGCASGYECDISGNCVAVSNCALNDHIDCIDPDNHVYWYDSCNNIQWSDIYDACESDETCRSIKLDGTFSPSCDYKGCGSSERIFWYTDHIDTGNPIRLGLIEDCGAQGKTCNPFTFVCE